MPPPHGLLRGNAERSRRRTEIPADARVRAAVAPAGPAPTTITGIAGGRSDEPGRGTRRFYMSALGCLSPKLAGRSLAIRASFGEARRIAFGARRGALQPRGFGVSATRFPAAFDLGGDGRPFIEIRRVMLADQVCRRGGVRVPRARKWIRLTEGEDEAGFFDRDRFRPAFGEQERAKRGAHFVLVARLEVIQAYAVDTRRTGPLNDPNTHQLLRRACTSSSGRTNATINQPSSAFRPPSDRRASVRES